MGLREIIENVIDHGAAACAGLYAIGSFYKGIATGNECYCQLGAIAAVICVGIEVKKYYDRKIRETSRKILDETRKILDKYGLKFKIED